MRSKAIIVAANMLSPSVRSLRLRPEARPLAFEAGQWVNVYVPTEVGLLKRAYSIASAPGDSSFELAITLVKEGEASPLLHALEPGSALDFDGPHGFFTQDAQTRVLPALYVGTGTGLAPLRSMLLTAATSSLQPPAILLFGCRTEEDILWRTELSQLTSTWPGLRIEVTLSRPSEGWQGRRGHVQTHVAELARQLNEPHVYICGLNRMVSEVRAICKNELGFDRRRIHSERYD